MHKGSKTGKECLSLNTLEAGLSKKFTPLLLPVYIQLCTIELLCCRSRESHSLLYY